MFQPPGRRASLLSASGANAGALAVGADAIARSTGARAKADPSGALAAATREI